MKIRFQADADLNPQVRRGLRVLRLAAADNRVLVTRDVATMPEHFLNLASHSNSPVIILLPSSRSIGMVIEGLFLIWLTEAADDFRNQIRWLP
ncbi:MAG: hypothetical protein HY820_22895 [Acidobacteria bacterium]|nr:hypothetical protein [Acidobacteriota bacterium]